MTINHRARNNLFIFISIISLTIGVFSHPASAAYCDVGGMGRAGCRGYFNNQLASANAGTVFNVISGGVYAGGYENFISIIMNNYNNGSTQNRRGAAFIMNVMLGFNAPGSGTTLSAGEIAEWQDRVRYYGENGWYDSSSSYYKADGTRNSAYFSDIANPAFHAQNGGETVNVITFNGPGAGNIVRIQRSCGNFVGSLASLDKRPATATIDPKAGNDGYINVGQNFTYHNWVDVSNVSNTGGDNFNWSITGTGPNSTGSTNISGSNPRVDNYHTQYFGTRGNSNNRRINITSAPSYATIMGGGVQNVFVTGWTLSASSSVVGTANVGQNVVFTHTFTNSGTNYLEGAPTHVGINANIWDNDYGLTKSFSSGPGLGLWGSKTDTDTRSYSTRGLHCQHINVSQQADIAGPFDSAQACVNIRGWGVSGTSTTDKSVAFVGQAVTFTHTITNSDPSGGAPTTIPINVDVKSNYPFGYPGPGNFAQGNVDCQVGAGLAYMASSSCGVGSSGTNTQTFSAPGTYCQRIGYGQISDSNGAWADSTQACVQVLDATPTTSVQPYEKGQGSPSGAWLIEHKLDLGINPCPAVTATWRISGFGGDNVVSSGNASSVPSYTNQVVNSSLGGATCSATVSKYISTAWLDSRTNIGAVATYTTISPVPTLPPNTTDLEIFEVPFTRFYGQDVRSCTGSNSNRFMFDDRATGDARRGSFGNLAAIYSAINVASTLTPSGLHTQADAGSRDSLRTSWAGMPACSSLTIPMPATTTALPVNLNPATDPDGKRYYNIDGDTTIGGGNLRGQVTINVNPTVAPNPITAGNITITGDITSNIPTGAFDYTTAPVLLIRANNIYISPGVRRIDAILVATGNIYTCGNDTTPARGNWDNAPTDPIPGCRNSLIVNGSMTAGGKIWFQRSIGTRFLADTSTATPSTAAYAGGNTTPAEIVNFPAYLNFMPLNVQDSSRSSYDAYYNLPPRL